MPTTLDTYAPFDSGAGANVTEDTWRKMARLWVPTGIAIAEANYFAAFADSTGMQVKVRTGKAWVQGHYGESTAEKTLAIAAAHATLPRIDRVILRADFVNNRVELDVLTGTAAASPAAPSLTQSSSVWEISLAQVSVPAADTSIDAGQVTDERTFTGENILVPQAAAVATDQSTTSTSYTDLATAGPAVSVQTGTRALVMISVNGYSSGANTDHVAAAISGATTAAAADANSARGLMSASGPTPLVHTYLVSGLTPGSNTFTLKYRVTAGTGNFRDRNLTVIPIP